MKRIVHAIVIIIILSVILILNKQIISHIPYMNITPSQMAFSRIFSGFLIAVMLYWEKLINIKSLHLNSVKPEIFVLGIIIFLMGNWVYLVYYGVVKVTLYECIGLSREVNFLLSTVGILITLSAFDFNK